MFKKYPFKKIKMTIKNQDIFRKFSIKQRLYTLFAIQIILSMIFCVYAIKINIQKEISLVQNTNLSIINAISINLQNQIENLKSVTKYPVLQTPNRTFVYNYLSLIENNSTTSIVPKTSYPVYSNMQNEYNQFFYLYPKINNVIIFDNTGKCISNIKPPSAVHSSIASKLNTIDLQEKWISSILERKGSVVFLPQSLTTNTDVFLKRETSLYAGRAIINADKIKTIGVILASCDFSDSVKIYNNNNQFDSQHFGIYNMKGEHILGDIPKENLKKFWKDISSIKASHSSNITSNNNKTVFSSGYRIYDYSTAIDDYIIIIETPFKEILKVALKKGYNLFIILMLLFICLIFILKRIIGSITTPIAQLMIACNSIQKGDFSIQISDEFNDEVSALIENFNAMTKEIRELICEGYEKDLLHNQLELQMLRAQINPHFLYNTLESIRATAYLSGQDTISEMATLLGKTLRYGISTPSHVVKLRIEVENLKDYIQLQKLRYGEKLDFILNIQEDIMAYYVIKVLLQPIVENAIYHGINSIATSGLIHIMGYQDKENIIFKVIDNGNGIEENTVADLNGYINNQNEIFKSIGLKNVNRRIQLCYGMEYGLVIQSNIGRGTMVTITIPCSIPSSKRMI